ncbi:hypothetical protein H271_13930 [Vibrio parahaemolyticus 1911C]|nr:hypothetical protein H271_13930 [Vibrio parahaemolyticus 1911C]
MRIFEWIWGRDPKAFIFHKARNKKSLSQS